jgi:hypothetical protein
MMHGTSKFGLIGVLTFALVLASGTAARAQTTLRYKFKQGEKLTYAMEQKMEMKMEVAGNNVDMNMTQTFDMTWDIKSVDKDGKAKMVQKFDRIRFVMEGGPIGKVEYDSKSDKELDDPVGKMIAPLFKALAGSDFELTMDGRGQISDLKVPEKLSEELKKLAGGGAPGLGDILSEDGLKKTINQGGLTLPEEAVTKGKTWSHRIEFKMGAVGKSTVDTTYTYEGPAADKKAEKITLKPKMTMEATIPGGSMKIKNQETKGQALFDNAAGRLLEMDTDSDIDMEISAAGMDIQMKMKQKVKMKLGDKSV